MKIVTDNRLPEIKRIEHLLYGLNYEVWLNLYGPFDPELGLEKALKSGVSKDAQLSDVSPSSPQDARTEIMDMILYEGDIGHGPEKLDEKREEIMFLMNKVFARINIDEADLVAEFGFRKGRPAYPVFWYFAYDIHSNGKRWVFIGSSSD
ncbi:hypothetical protein [Methylobacter sp. BBA5.1]|uniref:hypothetical protein n=1 Tax=Methylobacter sp. BBA5.1 TaxID=1495064 RepID=UPI00055FD3B6|nr:hypothetical protein [Methylobacter sp. BBA5.1]